VSKTAFDRSLSSLCVLGIMTLGLEANQTPSTAGSSVSTFEFVKIEPGSFSMGCSPGDSLCDADEFPAHPVRLTKPYEMGKYEVTQAQWQAIMGNNPSAFKGDDKRPVERVTWDEVKEFLNHLNERKDGYRYRLPTEAEWEYAARAGTTGPNYGPIDEIAWYQGNSDKHTHPVGLKKPNAWGLYDMQGNVYEWTEDWYGDYTSDAATDPTGVESGGDRIPRGGSWMSTPRGIRTSNRNLNEPDNRDHNIGFRIAREPAR
jgi:formylglycine-generating enzyme required for sulfatase activity